MKVFALLAIVGSIAQKEQGSYVPDARPPPGQRLFNSSAVDGKIRDVANVITDPTLRQMWRNTYASTLDTTVYYTSTGNKNMKGISFVVTGDIPAMWLRDSLNQVVHYIDVMQQDDDLQAMILGVVNLQAKFILENSFANAFKAPPETGIDSGDNYWATQDNPSPTPDPRTVWEMKYELDSLASFMRLAANFYNGASPEFKTGLVQNPEFSAALTRAMDVMDQLSKTTDHVFDESPPYRWFRNTNTATETSYVSGRGNQGYENGLVRSSFRPSDDSCILPYLIPSNAMAAAALHVIGGMGGLDAQIALRASQKSEAIVKAIEASKVSITPAATPGTSKIVYPFETDGYGSAILMDDANIPSLLSLPDLGYLELINDTSAYVDTRAWVLSDSNPWFFKTWDNNAKVYIEGVGSPHTGPQRVWPMSVAMRAITAIDIDPQGSSASKLEVDRCLKMLLAMNAQTGLMHEGVHVNDPNTYSRVWFAWANTVFGQLVLKIFDNAQYRDILQSFVFDGSVLS